MKLSDLGIVKLLLSKKFWFCMIIFVPCVILAFKGKLESNALAAIVGTLGSIYMWTVHKTEIASMQNIPPRGQP